MPRGKLIVIEGLDRAGKSTQSALLVEELREKGHNVRHLRFPDRTTPIGRMINSYLTGESEQEDHVIHLLFSANRWELASSITNDVESGMTVVVDRYYYSGCVYSAAKMNDSLSLAWARHPEEGLPRPDLCVFLDLDPAVAKERGGYGMEKYENSDMQTRVRVLFKEMASNAMEREDFVWIDAGASFEIVQTEIQQAVKDVFAKVDSSEGLSLKTIESW